MALLSLAQLNKIFYDLTKDMIGGDPEVRHSWPTGGAPAFTVKDNIAFLKIYDVRSPITDQQDTIYRNSIIEGQPVNEEVIGYTRTLLVNWIIYGALSWDWAAAIRSRIFNPEHRRTLSNYDIYLVPDFDPPTRMPELWQSHWYERCDLNMNFNELVTLEREYEHIEVVPIKVLSEKGLEREFEVDGKI